MRRLHGGSDRPPVLGLSMDEPISHQIDAVKGAVGKSGDCCGFLFLRDGGWESKVFGHHSVHELTLELVQVERFTRIFILEEDLKTMGAE